MQSTSHTHALLRGKWCSNYAMGNESQIGIMSEDVGVVERLCGVYPNIESVFWQSLGNDLSNCASH